ncbi:hypothetical protein PAXRUDRAFT_26873 [Paxillus rubicundulus Ve08.2h10]|uniref:Uncharacterized protein n=1 Tax=Paxillus rubicundulus Ve08.2h10 TaxID=930991 RepID=A0A0D0DL50_9AGAM|nr:hypothetical protein PAXRUDRAFT_26873 [Paxillus rubicundulus Ve08.2h10]
MKLGSRSNWVGGGVASEVPDDGSVGSELDDDVGDSEVADNQGGAQRCDNQIQGQRCSLEQQGSSNGDAPQRLQSWSWPFQGCQTVGFATTGGVGLANGGFGGGGLERPLDMGKGCNNDSMGGCDDDGNRMLDGGGIGGVMKRSLNEGKGCKYDGNGMP